MAVNPQSFNGKSMLEYVEASIEAMKDELQDKDWGIVGSIRTMAEYCDTTRHAVQAIDLDGDAEAKDRIRAMELHNKAIYTIPQIIAGLEKLGGSIAARQALGIKPEPKKSALAAVRDIRSGSNDETPAKPRTRTKKASGT